MKTSTYKIKGLTNGYIASRDINFNGKTEIELATGLTYDEARKKLVSFLYSDYDSMNVLERCENETDYLKFYHSGLISEMANELGISEEEYFDTHKNQLEIMYQKKCGRFEKFTGPGIYSNGQTSCCLLLADTDDSYEHDSRYYSIVEEI